MLKSPVIFALVSCFTVSFPIFAQGTSEEKLTYVQQAQKMLDQSSTQAKNQFAQRYPTPTAPTIQNSTSTPSKAPPPAPPKKLLPEKPAANNEASSNTSSYDHSPQVVSNAPVFTAPGVQQKNPSQPAQNIFIPPNSTANTTGAASAPNPYR